MTTQGALILASDYNALVPASSSDAGTASSDVTFGLLWGVGYGDKGYGQTVPTLTPVRQGDVIGNQWRNLLTVMSTLIKHTGTTVSGTLPVQSDFSAGSLVTSNAFDWASALNQLNTVRLNVAPSQSTTVAAIASDSAIGSWPTSNEIYCEFVVDFGTEDTARYFFNSGGQLQITPSLPSNTSDSMLLKWKALASSIGTISISAHATAQTNSGGTAQTIGYYELSDNFVEVFSQSSSDANEKIYLQGKREGYGAVNGGNGSLMRMRLYFKESTTSQINTSSTDPITVQISVLKAQSPLPVDPGTVSFQVSTPAIYVSHSLSTGLSDFFVINDIISTTVYNYDLMDRAINVYNYPPTSTQPIQANIVVTSTGKIGSKTVDTGTSIIRGPALTIPSTMPARSVVQIVNSGLIAGQGGPGGSANSWWGTPVSLAGSNGTTAVKLNYKTTISNQGIIGGGGGGGGGSGSFLSGETYDDPGGCGGGGAGVDGGTGGVFTSLASAFLSYPDAYKGQAGSALSGGAGGVPAPHGASGEWAQAYPGGAGGNLGQPGNPGKSDYNFRDTTSSLGIYGGLGGSAGLSVDGMQYLAPGSSLGDLRGQTDFKISLSGNTYNSYDFAGTTASHTLTTTVVLTVSTVVGTSYTWSQTKTSSSGISITTSAPSSGTTYNVTFSSSSSGINLYQDWFKFQVTSNDGFVTQPFYVNVIHNYVDSGSSTPVQPPVEPMSGNEGAGGGNR